MKAFQITSPLQSAMVEVSQPTLQANEVLLKVERVGLCGSDLNTYRGKNPLVSFPRIPGHEIAATILKIGTEVTGDFTIGSLVTVLPYTACGKCAGCEANRPNACTHNQTLGVQRDGSITEYLVVPEEKVITAAGLSSAQLALVEPLAVGFHAVRRARIQDQESVLVFGCGMIGLGVIAAASRHKATIIAVDIDDKKLERARSMGATHTINAATENVEEQVRSLTDQHGAHVTIEAVGLPQTLLQCVDLVRNAGRIVYIGYSATPVEYETKHLLLKEVDLMGSRGATRQDFDDVITYLSDTDHPIEQTITQTYSFEESNQAIEFWHQNPDQVTKIQIIFPS